MADDRMIVLGMMAFVCLGQGILSSCPASQFGHQCEYSCHCGTSCDRITGACFPGTSCHQGWFRGNSMCQKENIALGKTAGTTSGTWPGGWLAGGAVDGNNMDLNNRATCFHALNVPSDWTVDLGQEYQLYDIRVYSRAGYAFRITGSFIYVANDRSQRCYTFPSDPGDIPNPTDVTCNRTARYVTIRNPGTSSATNILNICEVEIYACSPGTYDINCSSFCHCSDCDRLTGICSGDCRPGWQGERCDIECIDTYGINCNKTCSDRKCSNDSAPCDRFTGSCEISCLTGWTEDDCTQKCGNLHYGRNCLSVCGQRHCSGNHSCHHVTGSCDAGCVAGWRGQDCQQECDNITYGVNCYLKCADRKCASNTVSCNRFNGSCDTVCQVGFTGVTCTNESYSSVDEKETTTLLSMDDKVNSSKNLITVVAGTVTAIVVIILMLVIVVVIVWRRNRRRPGKKVNSDHVYYNTATPGVNVRETGSQVSPEGSLPVGDDEGHTYTTIDPGCSQGNPESLDKSESLPDDFEPVMGRTYEKLFMSHDHESEYTGLERKYENTKRKAI